MNRITAAIARAQDKVDAAIKAGKDLSKAEEAATLTFDEHFRFQNLKTDSWLQGKLTQDEAQTLYGFLGNSPQYANDQPLAVRIILTQTFMELLAMKIKSYPVRNKSCTSSKTSTPADLWLLKDQS